MALNRIKGGHGLNLYGQSGVPDDLVGAGGVAEASRTAVAAAGDVVVLMVPDTPHVEAALFGDGGVAAGLATGSLVIDMSSISPIATKEFAAKVNALGCDYLDAPVSGGEVGAQQATLTIMEIGRASCRERVCQYV